MPGLNTTGNIIENFGHYYPTPIIDLIEVLPRGFNVTVSMYFNFSAEVTEEQVQDLLGKPEVVDTDGVIVENRQAGALDDLQIYVFYVLGKKQADTLITRKKTNLWSELVRWSDPLYKAQEGTQAWKRFGGINWLRKPFNEWTLDGEIYYDTNNNRVYKYYTTFEMPELFTEDANLDAQVTTTASTYMFGAETLIGTTPQAVETNDPAVDEFVLHEGFEGQITLFSFSSTINMDNFDESGAALITPSPFEALGVQVNPPWVNNPLPDTEVIEDDGLRSYRYVSPRLNENLIEKQFSDVSYEIVFRDGLINTADDLSYVDQDGQVYNAVPFKSLSGTYHKQGVMLHQQVIDLFNELSLSYFNENDEKIMSVIDTVSYILATAGHTPEIIPQLENFRTTYSADTNPATTTGAFYASYKDLILSVNSQILTGAPLEKKFLKNLKIFDNRVQRLPDTAWASPAAADNSDYNNSVYCLGQHKNGLMEVEYETGGATSEGIMSPNTAENLPSRIMKRGYFFFDAEKEIRLRSAFSQLYDVNLVTYLLPDVKSALNTHFQVQTANYYCLQAAGSWTGNPFTYSDYSDEIPTNNHTSLGQGRHIDLVCSHTQWFTNKGRRTVDSNNNEFFLYNNLPRPLAWDVASQQNIDTGGSFETPGVVRYENPNYTAVNVSEATAVQAGTQYAYIINRSFDTISTDSYPSPFSWPLKPTIDYNLWCFEFQDIQTTQESTAADVQDQAYAFGVTATDTTLTVVDQLTGSFHDVFLEFQEYYQLAQDNCAYGDAISVMNEQFAIFINDYYSSYPEDRKPWNLAPMTFHLHLQLLYRHYVQLDPNSNQPANNFGKMFDAVAQDIALVAPESATFRDIENFYLDYKALWDLNYSPQAGSDFRTTYDTQTREQTLTYGYDGLERKTTHFYAPMPDVMEIRPTYTSEAIEDEFEVLDFWTAEGSTTSQPRWIDLDSTDTSNLSRGGQEIVSATSIALGAAISRLLEIRGTQTSAEETLPQDLVPGDSLSNAIYKFNEFGIQDDDREVVIRKLSEALDFDMDWGDPVSDFEQIIVQTLAIVDSYLNGVVDRLINEGITFTKWTRILDLTQQQASLLYLLYELN